MPASPRPPGPATAGREVRGRGRHRHSADRPNAIPVAELLQFAGVTSSNRIDLTQPLRVHRPMQPPAPPAETPPQPELPKEPTARRAVADVIMQIIGRFGNLLLGSVVIVVLTRELGAAGFGQWSAIFAITQIAGYIGQLGLEPAAVRRSAEDMNRESDTLGALLLLRFLLSIPATATSIIAIVLLSETQEMTSAGIIAALGTILGVPSALGIVFQLRVRNDIPIIVMTINSLMWTGAVIGLAALGMGGLVPFSAALLAVQAFTSGLLALLSLRKTKVRFRAVRQQMGMLLKIGFVLGLGQLINFAYVRIDQVLVLHYTDETQAGQYGAAYQLLDRAQFLPLALMTTLLPLMVAAHAADKDKLRKMITRGFEVMSLVSLPVLAFSVVAAEPFMVLLFGEEFRESAHALPVLMGAFVLTGYGYILGNLALVVGTQGRLAINAAIALVFNVIFNVIFLPGGTYVVAAWATLLTELIVQGLAYPITLKRLGMGVPVGRLPRLVLAAAAMAGAVWGLRLLGANIWLLLLASMVTYVLAIVVFRAMDLKELRAMMRKSA